MKKAIIVILSLISFISVATTKIDTATTNLNGTWVPVKQEMGGKELPATFFAKQKLVILDSTYTVYAESLDKGILTYKDGKMDIFGKDGVNNGKHITAIYKIEDGNLIICYNLKGDSYPTKFESKSNPLFFMSTFKKEK